MKALFVFSIISIITFSTSKNSTAQQKIRPELAGTADTTMDVFVPGMTYRKSEKYGFIGYTTTKQILEAGRIECKYQGYIIENFQFSMIVKGQTLYISNQGAVFNDEVRKWIGTCQPERNLYFESIVVKPENGPSYTIGSFKINIAK